MLIDLPFLCSRTKLRLPQVTHSIRSGLATSSQFHVRPKWRELDHAPSPSMMLVIKVHLSDISLPNMLGRGIAVNSSASHGVGRI